MQAHDFVVENSSVTFFDRTQPYRPILDGIEFTDPPLKYFQSTKLDSYFKVIIGTTSDEAASIKVEFENETMTKDKFIVRNKRVPILVCSHFLLIVSKSGHYALIFVTVGFP